LACYQRRQPDLCRIAYGPEGEREIAFPPPIPKTYISYRVKMTWLAGFMDVESLHKYPFNRELGYLMIDVTVCTWLGRGPVLHDASDSHHFYGARDRPTLGRGRDLPRLAFNVIDWLGAW
jgi:hypothetical protein